MTDEGNVEAERQAALEEFRRLVDEEKDLYIGKPPDERIIKQYLKFAKYNVDEAFEKMRTLFRTKEMYSDFFTPRRDPELHDAILQSGSHQMLDYRDQLGRKIYLLRMSRFQFGKFPSCQLFQVDDLWFSLAMEEDETLDNGLVVLLDFEKVPWGIVRMFTPHNTRAMTAKAEMVPIRSLEYHIINGGYVLNACIRLTYPFLTQTTKDSIFVHKSLESLHEHISPSSLPQEYGGERPPVDTAKLVREYLDPNDDRLTEVLAYGYRNSNE